MMNKIFSVVIMIIVLTGLTSGPVLADEQTFAVTSPDSNATWRMGSTYTISWNSPEFFAPNYVAIYLGPEEPACLSANPPCSLPAIQPYVITARAPNTGSYQWTVPTNLASTYIGRQQIAITIEDTQYLGVSSVFNVAAASSTPAPTSSPAPAPTPTPSPVCREGSNIQYAGSPTIYYIRNCKKLPFTTSAMFKTWNTSFANVVTVQDSETYETSWFVRLPNDLLVKASNSPVVYKVVDSNLRPFVSAEAFRSYGYSFAQIKTYSPSDIALHYIVDPIFPR